MGQISFSISIFPLLLITFLLGFPIIFTLTSVFVLLGSELVDLFFIILGTIVYLAKIRLWRDVT